MKFVLLACSIALFLSCPAQQNLPKEAVCRGKSIPVTPLDVGVKVNGPQRTSLLYGGISQRSRLVIRDAEAFNQLWEQLTGQQSERPPLPKVDFSREMLVVAAMGTRPSSGFDIIVESACEVDNKLEVYVRSTDYSKCGLQLGVITAPADIVRVAKTDLPVVFRETEVSPDCKEP